MGFWDQFRVLREKAWGTGNPKAAILKDFIDKVAKKALSRKTANPKKLVFDVFQKNEKNPKKRFLVDEKSTKKVVLAVSILEPGQ